MDRERAKKVRETDGGGRRVRSLDSCAFSAGCHPHVRVSYTPHVCGRSPTSHPWGDLGLDRRVGRAEEGEVRDNRPPAPPPRAGERAL